MRRVAAILAAALLLGATPKPAPSPSPRVHENLAAIVAAGLDAAPANFAALRGPRYAGGGDAEISYHPSAAFATSCRGCSFRDNFGSAKTNEYWVMEIDWSGTWTVAQRTAFIIQTFSPFKKRFLSVKVGQNSDGETTIDFEGKHGLWMYLETDGSDESDKGFEVRIGHTLAKSVHVAPNSGPMTADQRTQFANAITNFIRTGLASADGNFATLMGKVHSDKDFHDANVSFGPMIDNPCEISAVIYTGTDTQGMSKYIFACDTIEVGGDKAAILELARSAVYQALPSNFTSDTDPKYLMGDDYRYDNGANTSVMIKIEDGSADRYDVELSIFRFVPNH